MMESDFVFTGESANSLEPVQKLIDQVISLAASGAVAGLFVATVVETGGG